MSSCPAGSSRNPSDSKNDKQTKSANQIVYEEFHELNKVEIDLEKRSAIVEGVERIPDGIIEVNRAGSELFDYKFSINDNPYYQTHRNNGQVKIGFNAGGKVKEDAGDGNITYVERPVEGSMQLMDRLNQAYSPHLSGTHI